LIGWKLVQEYHVSGNTVVEDASYLYSLTGLVKNLKTNNYCYQDARGSTSHLATATTCRSLAMPSTKARAPTLRPVSESSQRERP
jgi:hypothetical protein